MGIVDNREQRFLFADHFKDEDTGQTLSESPYHLGKVAMPDVSLYLLGLPAEEGARYLQPREGQGPDLGHGITYEGTGDNAFRMAIHPSDVPKFVQRVHAWRVVTEYKYVERSADGVFTTRDPGKLELAEALDILKENRLLPSQTG